MSIERTRAVGGVTILMRSNFDTKWFQVAFEHEHAAHEARARAVAAPDGSAEMGLAFDDELRATMVVIAAAAFAIDALYEKLDEMLEPSARSRTTRRVGNIIETLKASLELEGRTQEWQDKITSLFKLRDELVHFRGQNYPSQLHPTGKSGVSRENIVYTAEAATSAVDLALEVLVVAYTSPRTRHTALVAWATSNAHVPAGLEAERLKGDPRRDSASSAGSSPN